MDLYSKDWSLSDKNDHICSSLLIGVIYWIKEISDLSQILKSVEKRYQYKVHAISLLLLLNERLLRCSYVDSHMPFLVNENKAVLSRAIRVCHLSSNSRRAKHSAQKGTFQRTSSDTLPFRSCLWNSFQFLPSLH